MLDYWLVQERVRKSAARMADTSAELLVVSSVSMWASRMAIPWELSSGSTSAELLVVSSVSTWASRMAMPWEWSSGSTSVRKSAWQMVKLSAPSRDSMMAKTSERKLAWQMVKLSAPSKGSTMANM